MVGELRRAEQGGQDAGDEDARGAELERDEVLEAAAEQGPETARRAGGGLTRRKRLVDSHRHSDTNNNTRNNF